MRIFTSFFFLLFLCACESNAPDASGVIAASNAENHSVIRCVNIYASENNLRIQSSYFHTERQENYSFTELPSKFGGRFVVENSYSDENFSVFYHLDGASEQPQTVLNDFINFIERCLNDFDD